MRLWSYPIGPVFQHPTALQRRMLRLAIHALAPAFSAAATCFLDARVDRDQAGRSDMARRTPGWWSLSKRRWRSRVRGALRPSGSRDGSPAVASVSDSEVVRFHTPPSTTLRPRTGGHSRASRDEGTRSGVVHTTVSPMPRCLMRDRLALPRQSGTWRPGIGLCLPAWLVDERNCKITSQMQTGSVHARTHPAVVSDEKNRLIVGRRIDARFAATASTNRFISQCDTSCASERSLLEMERILVAPL